jgi:hypothetical protein
MISKNSLFEIDVRVEIIDYWRATYGYMFRHPTFRLLAIGASIYALVSLALFIKYPYPRLLYPPLVPLAATAVAFAILYLNTRLLYSSKKFLHHTVRYILSDEGIESVAPDAPGLTKWDQIPKALELRHDFLIFYTEERMYTIPKRSFQSPEQLARFKAVLQANLGPRMRLRNARAI